MTGDRASGRAGVPADVLELPAERTYKRDGRSVVWLARAAHGAWAIKRYEYSRVRQILALATGLHPAQRESRMNGRLAASGIGVVPIDARGVHHGRAWLATPERGIALQHLIAAGGPADRRARNALIDAVVDLWASLVDAGWFFRDFQVANIIVDDELRPWLIDVGDTRRSRSRVHGMRMLRQLYETAVIEGLTRADAMRGAHRAAERWGMGDGRALLRESS